MPASRNSPPARRHATLHMGSLQRCDVTHPLATRDCQLHSEAETLGCAGRLLAMRRDIMKQRTKSSDRQDRWRTVEVAGNPQEAVVIGLKAGIPLRQLSQPQGDRLRRGPVHRQPQSASSLASRHSTSYQEKGLQGPAGVRAIMWTPATDS